MNPKLYYTVDLWLNCHQFCMIGTFYSTFGCISDGNNLKRETRETVDAMGPSLNIPNVQILEQY